MTLTNNEKALESFFEIITSFNCQRFEKKLPVTGDGSLLDAIAIGINSLGRKLQVNTEMEEKLQKQIESVAETQAARAEFIANISHELRTPLNGVIGFSDLLSKTPLDQTQKSYTTIISQSAHAVLNLIDDFLAFTKLEGGKTQLDLAAINIVKASSHVTNAVKYSAEEKGLDFKFTIDTDIPHLICADEVKLKQVLMNLLSNAVKFTDYGVIELRLETLPASDSHHTRIKFSVIDTGVGIDWKNQQKIFDAFYQEDISSTKKYSGTGLGLTISNKLLTLMNSSLQVISQPNQGSIFYFDIEFKRMLELTEMTQTNKQSNTMSNCPLQTGSGDCSDCSCS